MRERAGVGVLPRAHPQAVGGLQAPFLSSAYAAAPPYPAPDTRAHTYPSTEKCKLFAVWQIAHPDNIFTMYKNMFTLIVFSDPCYSSVR